MREWGTTRAGLPTSLKLRRPETGQHPANDDRRLSDRLDAFNRYLAVSVGDALAGFVSITPPGGPGYSIDKYFGRDELPFPVDDGLFEIRLLTVMPGHRASDVAAALLVAAFRWVEARGGTRVMAIGRREVAGMYRSLGLREAGPSVRAGAVTYDLMEAATGSLREELDRRENLVERIERTMEWNLQVPLRKPAACFHGGAFFEAIGADFRALERHRSVINADVLDAWFPPAPGVLAALRDELPWLLRTSPPTGCEGLIAAIAAARGVAEASVLPGAGSSDLIFRALPRWLHRGSRALLLDPTYTARRDETHRMRARLAVALAALGWDVVPGAANFLLCHLPEDGPAARELVASCREQGLFLRDAAAMGSGLGERAIRIAVKDVATNRRTIGILSGVTGTRWLSRERRSSDRLERPPLPV